MHIWIDIDETISATYEAVLGHAKRIYPKISHITYQDLVLHDWWLIPEFWMNREDVREFFRIYDQFDTNHEWIFPVKNSVDGIRFLKSLWFTLSAITGRTESYARKPTLSWLDRHFPGAFSHVVFTNHTSDNLRKHKSEICKELWVSLMIEDNLDFALELAENNIASYVLEKPWNCWTTTYHEKITRVTDWQEIVKDFEKKYA